MAPGLPDGSSSSIAVVFVRHKGLVLVSQAPEEEIMKKIIAAIIVGLGLAVGPVPVFASGGDPWCADPVAGSPCDESTPPLPPIQCNPDGSNDNGEPCEPVCVDTGGNPCESSCQAVVTESAATATQQQRKIERQAKVIKRLRARLAK